MRLSNGSFPLNTLVSPWTSTSIFREHAIGILRKATGKLYFLYRCSASLDSFSRRLLCSALISSGLEYCCSAWYQGLLEEFKKDLATLQRKMVRFICGMGPREHVGDDEIRSLGWLPFPKRVDFFKMMHVFKVRKNIAPSYISQNFQLVNERDSLSLKQMLYLTLNKGEIQYG